MKKIVFVCLFLSSLGKVASGAIVVNELLIDPNSSSGANFDTDGNGSAETTDEFIELYNTSASSIDISGWQIWVGSGGVLSNRHTFAASTNVAPGGLVTGINEWNNGTVSLPSDWFEFDAGGGGIFGNGGDNFVILDPVANTYTSYIYNGDPDLSGNGLPGGATQVGATINLGNDTDGLSIAAIPDGSTNFSAGAPTPNQLNAVPEPSSLAILGIAGGFLSRRRRRS